MTRAKIYFTVLLASGVCWTGYLVLDACALSDSLQAAVAGTALLFLLALLFKPSWPLFGVGVVVCGGLLGFLIDDRARRTAAFRPIATSARRIAASSPRIGAPSALSGKALIWDAGNDRISPAYYRLPFPMRAEAGDQAMTIFFVWGIRSQLVDHYHKKRPWYERRPGDPNLYPEILADAYRDTADLAVISWPEQKLLGWHSVVGDAPPKSVQYHENEGLAAQHGDITNPVASWVRSMPFVPDPRNKPDAPIDLLSWFKPAAARQRTWTVAEAQAEAIRRYPQLGVANSPMNRAFVERYNREKAGNSALLRDPAWPLRIAEEVAQ